MGLRLRLGGAIVEVHVATSQNRYW